MAILLTDSLHPYYRIEDWVKYRLTYEGGQCFIEHYLKHYTSRETEDEFKRRKCLTFCPSFAEEALNEIKNAIYQRMGSVSRNGGSPSYMRCINAEDGGVNLESNGMNEFIGQEVLPELMVMGKVGVYVDMPSFSPDQTLAELGTQPHPYLYIYRSESILSWNAQTVNNEKVFLSLLLRETYVEPNDFGLVVQYKTRYRYMKLLPHGQVLMQIWEQYVDETMPMGQEKQERLIKELILDLPRIPFVMFDIGSSLLKNISNYQIALLNIESSDVNYVMNGNFTFYVEPYDPKTENTYAKKTKINPDGTETTATDNAGPQEIGVGVTRGRRYPLEADAPRFIHPSSEPLTASMKKQEQMKADMRALLNLAMSNVAPSRASADSKRVDQIGLESGLSGIGLELQGGERMIAELWAAYEKASVNKLAIQYPSTYEMKTDGQRMEEAKGFKDIKGLAPSKLFGKYLSIFGVRALLQGKVSTDELAKIEAEIMDAKYATADAKEVEIDVKNGLVSAVTASDARGYDGEAEVPKAQEEHAQRLKEIVTSQTAGAGVITGQNSNRKDTVTDTNTQPSNKRGGGKNNAGS